MLKKGQTVAIAYSIILAVSVIFINLFLTEYNKEFREDEKFSDVREQALRIGDILVEEPIPLKWDESDVKKPGLMIDGIIENQSLRRYSYLSYYKSKLLLGSVYDYIFYFEDDDGPIVIQGKEYFGWSQDGSNGGAVVKDVLDMVHSRSEFIAKDEKFVKLRLNGEILKAKLIILVWV